MPGIARAQSGVPSRPVTLVIGFSPGGSGDATLRLIAEAATRRFGVPVVVENRPGAGGTIAAERVARALPDGTTLTFLNNSVFTVTPYISRTPYDPRRDFTYVARYMTAPLPAYVASGSPHRSWDGLVAWARTNPGRLTWTTAAVNGAAHLATAAAFSHLSVDALNVPFGGMAQATTALLGGQIDLCVATDYPSLLAAGQVRLLAEIGDEPARSMPDVPTFGRMGYPLSIPIMFGLAGPAGLPSEVVAAWEALLRDLTATPEWEAFMTRYYGQSAFLPSAPFRERVLTEGQAIRAAVARLGIRAD
jgi:tripartite-type tricarboxylate transporter receptor subunit TctC